MNPKRTGGPKPPPLRECLERALRGYLETLDGHSTCDLHKLVIGEAERTLLDVVLEHTQGNQSRAAEMLSMNRGTLRKKLKQYRISANR